MNYSSCYTTELQPCNRLSYFLRTQSEEQKLKFNKECIYLCGVNHGCSISITLIIIHTQLSIDENTFPSEQALSPCGWNTIFCQLKHVLSSKQVMHLTIRSALTFRSTAPISINMWKIWVRGQHLVLPSWAFHSWFPQKLGSGSCRHKRSQMSFCLHLQCKWGALAP